MKSGRETFPRKKLHPYIVYNCAMSVDGKISTVSNDSAYSCDEDWMRVHQLRNSMDGICVGIGTVIADDPKLRVKFIEPRRNPHRIILDSSLRIPLESKLLQFERRGVRVIVGATSSAFKNSRKVEELKSMNVELIEAGTGTSVDLHAFWAHVKTLGIHSVLLEGGGTLAFSMLRAGLVDEVRTFTSPCIVGGQAPPATSMAMGAGFGLVKDSIRLIVKEVKRLGVGIYSRYAVER
ncbi:MAG: RibD family protein [Promethearchaeota archaeon]